MIKLNHRRLMAAAAATLALLELGLLEIKFQIMSGGGFLQSAPLVSLSSRVVFALYFLTSFIALFWGWAKLYRAVALRIGQSPLRADFTSGTLFVACYGLSLLLTFQLHKYLADHVDATVVRAIAGDSLQTAVAYASDELVLLLLPVLLVLALFVWLYRRVEVSFRKPRRSSKWPLVGFVAFLVAFVGLEASSNWPLKLNLSRSLSYGAVRTVAHIIVDVDGDGSSFFTTPEDPAPFNSAIHWGAVDIPANGVDENGLGGDLPSGTLDNTLVDSRALPVPYKHLVVIVGESTRADVIGKTLDGKLVAPNLTNLAAEGSSLQRAYSHSGFTYNSLLTLFSGRFTYQEGTPSLFDKAKAAGMQISVISGQDETWGGLDTELNTRKNADFFYDPQEDPEKRVFPSKLPSSIKLAGETLVEAFDRRLQGLDWSTRQLFYVNLQAGHFPYSHKLMRPRFVDEAIPRGEIGPDNTRWLRDTYWNSMSYMDQNVGKLIAGLKQAGVWDETLVIFLGDHGESLFHDGSLGHGQSINDQQLRIPVVMSAMGMNFVAPVGLSDVSGWLFSFVENPEQAFEKRGKCVLMYTGFFYGPAQLGQACTEREGLDVYTVRQKAFISQSGASEEAKLELIHNWERNLYKMAQPTELKPLQE
ncbi:sulfatase-like hydrolase/transferase [Kordiimonas sp.]|uniref:sulfatase-like hydrolase/transferase n=1 Tax=Kordiimonas sp. TaxID=1970157 RepID=UPI003A91BD07